MIPTESRAELYRLQQVCAAYGLSYTDLIWRDRCHFTQRQRPKSKSWPASCFDKIKRGYVLEAPPSNVHPIKRGKQ